jgi:hypothetical protein
MDPQLELVEQPVVEQQPRHVTEAVLHDVATVLALEVADAGDDVAGDHLGARPLWVAERGRHDDLAHRVDAVRERVAAAGRPRRGEAVVRAAAHQDDVAGLEQVGLDHVALAGGRGLQGGHR